MTATFRTVQPQSADSRPVFGYTRASSNQQELARQERTIPDAHSRLPDGLAENDLILFSDDGISAYKDVRRPDYEELTARIGRGEASALIIDTSSRLTRKGIPEAIPFFLKLWPHHTRLFTTQGREYTPDIGGLIQLGIDADRDNGYSRDLAHNVKTGRQRIAALGGWSGGPAPIGYRTTRHPEKGCLYLVPDEPAASVIRAAFERYARGEPIHRVSGFLAESLPKWPRTRKRDCDTLRHATRKLLRNETYLGLLPRRTEGVVLPGLHEALVDKETFERCQARLASNAREWAGITPVQSFGNQLRCGSCGARCNFHRPRKEWTYYRCSNPACRKQKATASYVEASFATALAAVAVELHERLDDPSWAVLKTNADRLAAVERDLAKIDDQTNFILEQRLADALTNELAAQRLAELKERRAELETYQRLLADDGTGMRNALTALRDQLITWSEAGVKALGEETWLGSFFYTWAFTPVEYRRTLVQVTTERIELRKGEIAIHFRAGIFITVPFHSGRREHHYAPGLEGLGFGKPRNLADAYALDPSLREGCESSASSSSHSSTAPRREVGAFSQ